MLEESIAIEDLEKRMDALLAAFRLSLYGDEELGEGLYEKEKMDELLHRAKSRTARRNQRMGWGT